MDLLLLLRPLRYEAPSKSGSAMVRCLEAEDVALVHLSESLPLANCLVEWSDRRDDLAIVVASAEGVSAGELLLWQVCCVAVDGSWNVWSEGSAPGWLEVDNDRGVVVSVYRLEPGVDKVRIGEEEVEVGALPRLFRALWDVTQDAGSPWEPVVECHLDGNWVPPALPSEAVTQAYLVDTYLRFEADQAEPDRWAWTALMDASSDDPERAWPIVQAAISAAPDERLLYIVAAGPLEQLVSQHLDILIDRIEATAARDPTFRRALGGVWAKPTDDLLRERLVRAVGT